MSKRTNYEDRAEARSPAGLKPGPVGTNRSQARARELLTPAPGGRASRAIARRRWPALGGRAKAGDRGRAPGVIEVRRGREIVRSGRVEETRVEWSATRPRPWVVRASNRAAGKRARQARKAGRR